MLDVFGEVNKSRIDKTFTREDLILNLQNICIENNRIPLAKDVKSPCVKKYVDEFGSFNNALSAAFGSMNREKTDFANVSEEELLNKLVKFKEKHGRIPTMFEAKNPTRIVYQWRFGSWNNALLLAFGESNINTKKSQSEYVK